MMDDIPEEPHNHQMIPLNALNSGQTSNTGEDISKDSYVRKKSNLWPKLIKQMFAFGLTIASIAFLTLVLRFCIKMFVIRGKKFSNYYIQYFIKFLIMSYSIVFYALPISLLISLPITYLYSRRRMRLTNISIKDKTLIENIANLNTIIICHNNIEDILDQIPDQIIEFSEVGITVIFITNLNIDQNEEINEKLLTFGINSQLSNINRRIFYEHILRDSSPQINQQLFNQILPELKILSQFESIDKYNFIKHLIESKINEEIAVIGRDDSDVSAIEAAHFGVSLGTIGTESVKQVSQVVLTNNQISDLVSAVILSRNYYAMDLKLLRLSLTINLVVVLVETICLTLTETYGITFMQYLWIQIIINLLITLSYVFETIDESEVHRKQHFNEKSVLNKPMIINITLHSIYQIIVIIINLLYLRNIFIIDSNQYVIPEDESSQLQTIVFNILTMMSIFNALNTQMIGYKTYSINILSHNLLFYVFLLIALLTQIVFTQYLFPLSITTELTIIQWLWCLFFGISVNILEVLIILIYNCFSIRNKKIIID